MESTLATAARPGLIKALSFTLPSAANYVQARTNATWFPQGGNQYTPTGVRLIRFQIADPTQFLDPHNIRLQFTLKNDEDTLGKVLQLTGPPFVLFQRARLLVNGVVVEDMMYQHRTSMMLYQLQPQRRNASNILEWTWRDDHPTGSAERAITGGADFAAAKAALATESAKYSQIAPGASKRFLMELPFGLFQQPHYLMLKACPITIELELVQDPKEAVWSNISAGNPLVPRSEKWTILDVQLKADTCRISQDIVETYNRHLLSGNPLPIPFSTYTTQMMALPGNQESFNVQVARAFTRLKTIYFTFYKAPEAPLTTTQQSELYVSNYFYYPAPGSGAVPPSAALTRDLDTLSWQLTIGATTWPVYPVRGVNETAYRLKCAVDQAWGFDDFDITMAEYISTKFIAAVDVEKAASGPGAGASWSGISTRGGEQLLLDFKDFPRENYPTVPNGALPTRIYVTAHYDCILNVRAEGVVLED